MVTGSFPKLLAFLFINICYIYIQPKPSLESGTTGTRQWQTDLPQKKIYTHGEVQIVSPLSKVQLKSMSSVLFTASKFQWFWVSQCLLFMVTLVLSPTVFTEGLCHNGNKVDDKINKPITLRESKQEMKHFTLCEINCKDPSNKEVNQDPWEETRYIQVFQQT